MLTHSSLIGTLWGWCYCYFPCSNGETKVLQRLRNLPKLVSDGVGIQIQVAWCQSLGSHLCAVLLPPMWGLSLLH